MFLLHQKAINWDGSDCINLFPGQRMAEKMLVSRCCYEKVKYYYEYSLIINIR